MNKYSLISRSFINIATKWFVLFFFRARERETERAFVHFFGRKFLLKVANEQDLLLIRLVKGRQSVQKLDQRIQEAKVVPDVGHYFETVTMCDSIDFTAKKI